MIKETIVGKKFVKNTIIEVVKVTKDGVIVQNKGDSTDQWLIVFDVFNKTYDELK